MGTSFVYVIVLFDEAFKSDDRAKFVSLSCVELCNFVKCHILLNVLRFAINEIKVGDILLFPDFLNGLVSK
jgi:hypothetical protein